MMKEYEQSSVNNFKFNVINSKKAKCRHFAFGVLYGILMSFDGGLLNIFARLRHNLHNVAQRWFHQVRNVLQQLGNHFQLGLQLFVVALLGVRLTFGKAQVDFVHIHVGQ